MRLLRRSHPILLARDGTPLRNWGPFPVADIALELRNRDRERKLIKKIDETILKIDADDYGFCESCGAEIGLRRLEARPTATLCIDCLAVRESLKERATLQNAASACGCIGTIPAQTNRPQSSPMPSCLLRLNGDSTRTGPTRVTTPRGR